jgi:predicted CopG family antitoxin
MLPHTYTHRESDMGTKNIAISDEAYQRLKSLKKPGESFTELIERMTQQKGVLDLAGVLTFKEGRTMTEAIGRMREESSNRMLRVARSVDEK